MAHFGAPKNPPWVRESAPMNQQAMGNMVGNMGPGNMNQGMMTQGGMMGMGGPNQMGSANQMGGPNQMGGNNQQQPSQLQFSQGQGVGLPQLPMQYSQAQNFAGSQSMGMQQSMQPGGMTQNMGQMPQTGMGMGNSMGNQSQNITYPTPRPPGSLDQPPPPPPGQGGPQKQQRVFTGIVTKLHDNFGFVDEEVFFQTSIVKGVLPKVGDRVLVEATYNAAMPFKWNAARIQVLPVNQNQKGGSSHQSSRSESSHGSGGSSGQSSGRFGPPLTGSHSGRGGASYNQVPPPLMSQTAQPGPTLGRSSIASNMSSSRRSEGSSRDGRHTSPGGRHRTPPGGGSRKRSRSPRRRSRSRSPARRSSPAYSSSKKSKDSAPRYNVVVPKTNLDLREATVVTLKARYSNMYVPSDFFHASCLWNDAFPPHRPFDLGDPCTFHVMPKDPGGDSNDGTLEPPDADHLYSAKVMLLSRSSFEDIHKQCCPSYEGEEGSYQHPTRLIHFLVGLKGKEPLAIGGPWSPSLDGANPKDDPQVLINTAIRTTKALTGINLSGCTQWYRFAEIHYFRPEEVHKGRTVPSRLETVVLFLPDIWSVYPSRLEWEAQCGAYRKRLAARLKEELGPHQDSQEEETGGDETKPKVDPKHFSELDPKSMKVADLRIELSARGLTEKGIRSQLIARLTKAMKSEQQKEEEQEEEKKEEAEESDLNVSTQTNEDTDDKKDEDEKKQQFEKEKARLEKLFALPTEPAIIVHPSTTAKNGKFDCSTMSLSVLLDYRPDDNKEHTFEVSLFAELFTEMLMRDAGFLIYKALVAAPDFAKAEREEKERKEREKKEKKEKEEQEEEKKEKDKDKDGTPSKKDGEEPPAKRRKEDERDRSKKDDDRDRKRSRGHDRKDDSKKKEKDDSRDDDDDEDTRSVGSQSSLAAKQKAVVKDPKLLLAFSHFDLSHCGYFQEKDVEELLTSIGLCLSRAQVKKLVSKLLSKDKFKYRRLTDAAVEKTPPTAEKEQEESMDTSEQADAAPPTDEELAKGNHLLLQEKPTGLDSEALDKNGDEAEESSSNLITYQGAVIDINQLMLRLEKSEKLKRETDQKLASIEKEMGTLRDSCNKTQKQYEDTKQKLETTQKTLKEQQQSSDKASAEASRCRYTLISTQKSLLSAVEKIKQVVEIESHSKKDAKKDELKKDDTKKDDGKKDEVKKEEKEVKKEEVKKEEVKKEEVKEETKKDEIKKEVVENGQ